jgi:aryl-alcohol dehydrogenase-like predicted oxidoreductase
MRRVALGASGLQVGVVGQGTMGLGGFFDADSSGDQRAIVRIQRGLDRGLNFIDTAEKYGGGHTEELVGSAIAGRRHAAVVATKFSPEHSSARAMTQAVESSLRRLQLDRVDMLQTHWPSSSVPFEETIDGLRRLIDDGKVKTVGLSNSTAKQRRLMASAFTRAEFVSIQEQLNAGDRRAVSTVLPTCEELQIAFVAYSPLLEGRLVPDGRRHVVESIARARGDATPAQIVLAWVLSMSPAVIVIPKAARETHAAENAAAADIALSIEERSKLDDAFAEELIDVDVDAIDPAAVEGRCAYRTIQDALRNADALVPSPAELARELLEGEEFRPVKIQEREGRIRPYVLVEGRLRYWAWILAFGDRTPIRCVKV